MSMKDANIAYVVAMPQPHSHLFEMTLTISALSGPSLDVALPVWTPGSYMVREYARHVQEFSAEAQGQPLAWRKIDKSTWRIETDGASSVTLRYKVYAFEVTVRTSHLDGSHGYVNPATLCLYVPGRLNEPHAIEVVPFQGWYVSTGLPRQGDGWDYLAQDYDELVDSPFECGTHRLLSFEVDGIPHEIALWGHGNEDEAQFLADVKRIVETERDMFGGLPYRYYLFIFHLATGYGGLEHRNSVSNLVDRWSFQPRRSYERVLALTSHEFFHVWNVKRIRPEPLGPFDYSRENYTTQLWTMEGVTSYYDNLLLLRSGLISPARYLEMVADDIAIVQGQPGRALQNLEESSFDTWIKFYRPDENSGNTSISYYVKGAMVSLLLDLEIRQRTANGRSLDDVLRALFAVSSGPGFAEDGGYQEVVEEIGTGSFDDFFRDYVAGTEELAYDTGLALAGLRLEWSYQQFSTSGETPAWLGVRYRHEQDKTLIASVRSDGPAYAAGLYAGDEIVAFNDFRANEEKINARLAELRPGDTVIISVFRREQLLHIPVTLAPAAPERLRIVSVENPTEEQLAFRRAWLGSEQLETY